MKKCLLYLTWDSWKASKVRAPQPSAVHSTNCSRFGCKCLTCWSSREKEQTVHQSNTKWHDVPQHCRTDHPILVSPRSCAVLCWGEALKRAHPRARDSQQAPGNARPMHSVSKSTVAGSHNWLGKQKAGPAVPRTPIMQRYPLWHKTERDSRQHAKGLHHCNVTTAPPCWRRCATALFVPRFRVTLWNYNLKDLSSRQLS